jgi:serine/threonine protein phosphatase PrpC
MPLTILSCSVLLALLIIRFSMGFSNLRVPMDVGMATIIGKREINADVLDWSVFGAQYLFTAAGGIGRGRKGSVAAEETVRAVGSLFEISGASENPAYFFQHTFRAANDRVLRRIVDSSGGASLLCAVIKDRMLYYALAGNCRIAIFRNGSLIPLSEGHTINVLAKKAFKTRKISRTDALTALRERRLYNYVGHDGFKDLEMFDTPVSLKKGDVMLMMTSGVSDFCSFGKLEEILSEQGTAQRMAEGIINHLIRENNPDQDNASVILVRFNQV